VRRAHADVMAITKMSIWMPPGEPVHRSGDIVAPVWPHPRRMVRAGCMEKIMSKINDSSFTLDLVSNNDSSFTLDLGGDVTGTTWRRDDELQNVSGGFKKATGNTKWGDIVLKGG
jgi:hypothetical protein